MKLLAILRPRDGIDAQSAVMEHAREELHALWDLYRSGFVREMYSPGGPGAILVLEADSREEAAGRLADLPLLAADIMTLELIQLHPFGAMQMLFADQEGA
jgi:hypothetical protein